jgi:protein gp37
MSDNTKIEWATSTWNPIIGCSHVSPGCNNCYAERMANRLASNPLMKQAYAPVITNGKWNSCTHLIDSALEKPFQWKKPRTIFVCSMSDLFHESTPFEWVDKVIDVIRWAKNHTYLILTKRPQKMFEYFTKHVPEKYMMDNGNYLDNLWLGVTSENQEEADKRIPILLQIPAAKRFVSVEPMLGPVDFSSNWHSYLDGWETIMSGNSGGMPIEQRKETNSIDWVIVGSESGPGRRECKEEWVKDIINQCESAMVPVFVKQLHRNGKKVVMPEINGKIYNQRP